MIIKMFNMALDNKFDLLLNGNLQKIKKLKISCTSLIILVSALADFCPKAYLNKFISWIIKKRKSYIALLLSSIFLSQKVPTHLFLIHREYCFDFQHLTYLDYESLPLIYKRENLGSIRYDLLLLNS